jgi:hypothetical protein
MLEDGRRTMVKVGDRVALESERVGQPEQTGVVKGIEGRLIRVSWDDGRETAFIPASGSLHVIGPERKTTRQP